MVHQTVSFAKSIRLVQPSIKDSSLFVGMHTEQSTDCRTEKNNKHMALWLWSREGNMGKSTWVKQTSPGYYDKMPNQWWDNYRDEEVVPIDDPDEKQSKQLFSFIKWWISEEPVRVEFKNSSYRIRPKRFILCSNKTPPDFFKDAYEASPFEARFTTIDVTKPLYRYKEVNSKYIYRANGCDPQEIVWR